MGSCDSYYYDFGDYIDERKLLYYITLTTFITIGTFLFIVNKYSFFDRKKIPIGAKPKIPFGNAKDVILQDTSLFVHLWKYYNRFKRKGYKIGGLFLLFKPLILVIDQKIINEVLTKEKFFVPNDYKKPKVAEQKLILKLENLLTTKQLNNVIKEYQTGETNFVQMLTSVDKSQANISSLLINLLTKSTLKGVGFESLDDIEDICDIINDFQSDGIFTNLLKYLALSYESFDFILNIFNRGPINQIEKLLGTIISNRKKNDIRKDDLIQIIIDEDINGKDGAKIILQIIADYFQYSYSTSLFCLYELCKNMDVQDELLGEIRRFRKENKTLDLENLENLVYLEAVVKETLRKYPPVPLISKRCVETYRNADLNVEVPKGCLVFISTYAIHHDMTIYTNPEMFDPDRFFEENKKLKKTQTFLSLGYNPKYHNLGEHICAMQVKLVVITILSLFKIELAKSDYKIEFDDSKFLPFANQEIILKLHPI